MDTERQSLESIANGCLPMFEGQSERIKEHAARAASRLPVACSGIYEIGPHFADAGICLEAPDLPLNDVTFGCGAIFLQRPHAKTMVLRVTAGWHRYGVGDGQACFSILEFSRSCYPSNLATATAWCASILPSLESAALEAVHREKPPSHLRHLWQRWTRRIPAPTIMTSSGMVPRMPVLETFHELYDAQSDSVRPDIETR